jgi:hypothetical protein
VTQPARRTAWTDLPRYGWILFAAAAVLGLVAGVLAILDRDVMALAWLGLALTWTGFAVVTFQGRRTTRIYKSAKDPGR